MADKLQFNLVSPERQLMSADVDHVIVPGSEGQFGVLPGHAPFMSTMTPGVVTVLDGSDKTDIFVAGGFAEVTPDGLTILAEEATPVAELQGDVLAGRVKAAEDALAAAANDDARLAAQAAVDQLKAL
ncbi:MAG: F0F1 ATP synthase subunit epsilon [Pseudomonadota bacterium]